MCLVPDGITRKSPGCADPDKEIALGLPQHEADEDEEMEFLKRKEQARRINRIQKAKQDIKKKILERMNRKRKGSETSDSIKTKKKSSEISLLQAKSKSIFQKAEPEKVEK